MCSFDTNRAALILCCMIWEVVDCQWNLSNIRFCDWHPYYWPQAQRRSDSCEQLVLDRFDISFVSQVYRVLVERIFPIKCSADKSPEASHPCYWPQAQRRWDSFAQLVLDRFDISFVSQVYRVLVEKKFPIKYSADNSLEISSPYWRTGPMSKSWSNSCILREKVALADTARGRCFRVNKSNGIVFCTDAEWCGAMRLTAPAHLICAAIVRFICIERYISIYVCDIYIYIYIYVYIYIHGICILEYYRWRHCQSVRGLGLRS